MPFDPEEFAAKVVLGELHPEDMPAAAQDALEAGYDGPAMVRLAILEDPSGWETDQLLPRVFEELKLAAPSLHDAAIVLAKTRARRILATGEDPLASISYFHNLLVRSDYAKELDELGWLDEDCWESGEAMRAGAFEAIENLFYAEIRQRRWQERMSKWESVRKMRPFEWPYALNTPRGRKEYWSRLRTSAQDRYRDAPWLLPAWVLLVLGLAWLYGSWWVAIFCFFVFVPLIALMNMIALWRTMRHEVQALRWRDRIDL